MSEQIKFYKGTEANLPTSDIEIGALYHCEDTGNTYRGISATELELFSSAVGKKTLDNGEIFNDYVNNTTIPKDGVTILSAHAEGEHTSAGWRSHSEGYLTIANSTSHAEGRLAQAIGKASHAEGYELNIDFKDASGNTITVLLTENANITDSFIVVDQVPSTLQVNDAIYITSNGAAQIEATDSKIITKIEGNVLTLHAPFLADNYQSTKYENDPTIIPIGAKVKYAQRTKALGNGAHAEGQGTSAIAPCSHSEGTGTIAGRIIGYDEKGKPIYKGKQAHAEGYVTEAIGEYSHAEGHGGLADGNAAHKEGIKTIANGNGAHAEGDGSQAIGPVNHAEGYNTIANNTNGGAHSEGHTTRAYGLGSHAEGRRGTAAGAAAHIEGQSDNVCLTVLEKENFTNVTNDEIISAWDANKFALAKGTASHVEGQDCIALASFSHAEGYQTQATGSAAHAEGGSTKALNETAHAEGQSTQARGKGSHAQGGHTEAIGNYSHAGGYHTRATGPYQTVIGKYSRDDDNELFIIGNGTDGRSSNIMRVNDSRLFISSDENYNNGVIISGEGVSVVHEGPSGFVNAFEGDFQYLEGDTGSFRNVNIKNSLIVKGSSVLTMADRHNLTFTRKGYITSIYNGSSNKTIDLVGKKTAGEIFNTYSGDAMNIASASASHAEGLQTSALGTASHAEGYNTVANGGSTGCAHAEGNTTKALAPYSHAEGFNTTTSSTLSGQHVQGRYNVPDDTSAHIVGWGDKNTPKNIHTLSAAEGNAWYAGTITSDGIMYMNATEKVATENYVDIAIANLVDSSPTTLNTLNELAAALGDDPNFATTVTNYIGTVEDEVDSINDYLGGGHLYTNRISDSSGNTSISLTDYEIILALSPGPGYFNINEMRISTDLPIYIDDDKVITQSVLTNKLNSHYVRAGLKPGAVAGEYSTAEGYYTTSSGRYSHAEGISAIAEGPASHAEGYLTKATGGKDGCAHAEGNRCGAFGFASHAEGVGTRAKHKAQHVQGTYNQILDKNYAHIVGNGSGDDDRKNCHWLKWNGDAWYAGTITGTKVYGAVWNDYAEYRQSNTTEPGRVICENGDDTLSLATKRLQPGAEIISDTFGFAIGETDTAKTPIAVSGRVLAYTYEDRTTYAPGDAVCAAPNGTVSKMTREEIMMYPERIIGTVSAIPTYETWGTGNVPVNGRIWIKVK